MRKKFIYLIFGFLVFPSVTVFSQELLEGKDTVKGFDFFFNAGMYLGSKLNANYYRGLPDPIESNYADPNIWYVLDNKYWHQDILNLIDDNHNDVILDPSSFRLESLSEMKYNLAFSFGIGARYRFSESFALSILFSQVRLTAEGIATFGIKGTGVNLDQGIKYLDYKLLGKERRNFFEVDVSYFFITTIPYVFPFVELGVHLNSTKVLSSDLIVEGVPFSMINWYGEGTIVDPSISYTEINPQLGGIGWGIIGSFGVRLAFNQWAAIEPVVQVSAEKVNLSSYGTIRPNFNFMIRLVVGDKLFAKKQ